MRKRLICTIALLVFCFMLSGCCQHEWVEATCTSPRHCVLCGQKEGSTVDHDWMPATCDRPMTCRICATTDGEANGHVWSTATCTEPETCSICGATQGLCADHDWIEANCVRPKHCAKCGTVEGSTSGHIWINATYRDKRYCSVCGQTEGEIMDASFSRSGYEFNITEDEAFTYTTLANAYDEEVTGTAMLTQYIKYDSDAEHEYREGYEWRETTVKYEMPTGTRVMWGYTDYFIGMDSYPEGSYVTYPDNTRVNVVTTESYEYEWEDDKCISYGNYAIQVPKDYKYLIFYVCNANYPYTQTVDPNIHFFNMN